MAYKYDPELLELLEKYVGMGMTDENSAVLAFDIDRSTYYEWVGDNSKLTEKEKSDLKRAIYRGKATRNHQLIEEIRKATAEGDGRLALDLLKRLESKAYGDKQSTDIKTSGDPLIIIKDGNTP